MTREEARKAAEVMLAYAEGKDIEFSKFGDDLWEVGTINNLGFNFMDYDYRIKKEPTYRPFKDKEECWEEMRKHQPFGWVNFRGLRRFINCLYEFGFSTDVTDWTYDEGLREFTFADGTPFGIKEEMK